MNRFLNATTFLLTLSMLLLSLVGCAPADVKKNVESVAEKVSEAGDAVGEKVSETSKAVDEKVSEVSEKVNEEISKASEVVSEAVSEAKELINGTKELKKVDFILDWTPNTNHCGLFVAKAKGYFEEIGIDLDIKQPPEDSTSDLIINNKAPFGIYFQDSMAAKLSKGAPLVAVAAIVAHNTSGIIATEKSGIKEPKDMPGKRYGTWNDPMELAMLKSIVEKQGGKYEDIQLIPNTDANSIVSMENNMFDSAWIYYGWDGIMAETQGLEMQYFYFKDYAPELDFYSPIIISNETYLKENPDEAKAILKAIKKGYQYAMEHPEEAADILMENAPELKEQKDFVYASQKYLSGQYADDAAHWGEFDPARWNAFYEWVNANKITEDPIPQNAGFSNDYLKD